MIELTFLKLGGSLITDKTRPYTPRLDKLRALADEIRTALRETKDIRLVLGHGSGSFGHYAVKENLSAVTSSADGDHGGPDASAYWRGHAEVWYRASELNRHVMDALRAAGVPAISLPPSSTVTATDGTITHWDLSALEAALDSTLVPVIFGDIVFDRQRRGSVLSTEVLMHYLAHRLRPRRILLAGLEEAVWADYPARHEPVKRITPGTYERMAGKIGASHGTDVTGGMKSKVEEMLELATQIPGLAAQIFSGEEPGNVARALSRAELGTLIAGD